MSVSLTYGADDGDESVGIYDTHVTLSVNWRDVNAEERESIRDAFVKFCDEHFAPDATSSGAVYNDECGDCHGIVVKGQFPNDGHKGGCPSSPEAYEEWQRRQAEEVADHD